MERSCPEKWFNAHISKMEDKNDMLCDQEIFRVWINHEPNFGMTALYEFPAAELFQPIIEEQLPIRALRCTFIPSEPDAWCECVGKKYYIQESLLSAKHVALFDNEGKLIRRWQYVLDIVYLPNEHEDRFLLMRDYPTDFDPLSDLVFDGRHEYDRNQVTWHSDERPRATLEAWTIERAIISVTAPSSSSSSLACPVWKKQFAYTLSGTVSSHFINKDRVAYIGPDNISICVVDFESGDEVFNIPFAGIHTETFVRYSPLLYHQRRIAQALLPLLFPHKLPLDISLLVLSYSLF